MVRLRNSAVSPVSFPAYGPIASASTIPVTSEVNATARSIGKPSPSACVVGCGYSAWLASVSGIENVVPSMTTAMWVQLTRVQMTTLVM